MLWSIQASRTQPLRTVLRSADRTSVITGDLAMEIDQTIERTHPFQRPALEVIAAFRYALFREGTGAVVIGEENRLFTREEFEHHPADSTILGERIATIRYVEAELTRSRQNLLILVLPSKARVLQRFLPSRWRSLADHWRWEAALQEMRRNGLHVIAPLAVLKQETSNEPMFLRRDTHWTPSGAGAVARDIAQFVQQNRLLDDAPRRPFSLLASGEVLHTGDLVQFVPLPKRLTSRIMPPEPLTPVRSVDRGETPGGLFDLPEIPVVLIGTSFSAGTLWSFPDHLRAELSADVLDLSEEGRGPFAPMLRYLEEGPPEGVAPTLVIWEIPERYLTLPAEP